MVSTLATPEARPDAQIAAIPAPREQELPWAENVLKSLLAIGLLLGTFQVAGRVSAAVGAAAGLHPAVAFGLEWGAVALLGVVSGIFVTAMIALAHEAVHRVFCRSRFWNEAWGGLLSALSLVPLHANRQFHLTHHGYAHQPGKDPENAMHRRPFLMAATIGSFVGIREQYKIFLHNVRHVRERKYAGRVAKDTFFIVVAAAFYFVLVPALGTPVTVSVLPMLLVFPLVFSFRALSDHYGVPATEQDSARRRDILDQDAQTFAADAEKREREVTGWVVLTAPWLEWLWSGANLHEVHHRYPNLSHRYLRGVFESTRGTQPYYTVRGYWRSIARLWRLDYYSDEGEFRARLARDGDPVAGSGGRR